MGKQNKSSNMLSAKDWPNGNQKRAVVIFISEKIDFKSKIAAREK